MYLEKIIQVYSQNNFTKVILVCMTTDIGFSKKHRPRKRDAALLAAKGDSASKKIRFYNNSTKM